MARWQTRDQVALELYVISSKIITYFMLAQFETYTFVTVVDISSRIQASSSELSLLQIYAEAVNTTHLQHVLLVKPTIVLFHEPLYLLDMTKKIMSSDLKFNLEAKKNRENGHRNIAWWARREETRRAAGGKGRGGGWLGLKKLKNVTHQVRVYPYPCVCLSIHTGRALFIHTYRA